MINWYYNGELIDQNITSVTQNIEHSTDYVSVQLTTDETCVNNNIMFDTIQVVHFNPIVWDLPAELELEYGSLYELDLSSNANTWTWSTPENLSDHFVETPTITATVNEWKHISMKNGLCSALDSIEIKITKELLIPNAFTPNNDGSHDTWHLSGIENYPNVIIKIYNRWGNIVYESAGYFNEWNGSTNNGKPLPVATYYYILYLNKNQTNPSAKNSYEGHVTIIR